MFESFLIWTLLSLVWVISSLSIGICVYYTFRIFFGAWMDRGHHPHNQGQHILKQRRDDCARETYFHSDDL